MAKLNINSEEVIQFAQKLFSVERFPSVSQREAAMIVLAVRPLARRIQNTDILMHYRQFIPLYRPEYSTAAPSVRRAMEKNLKQRTCELSSVSSVLRGDMAFMLYPVPEEAFSLRRKGAWPPSEQRAKAFYRPGVELSGLAITVKPDGIAPSAWIEANIKKGTGLMQKFEARAEGWSAAGLLTSGSQARQLPGPKPDNTSLIREPSLAA